MAGYSGCKSTVRGSDTNNIGSTGDKYWYYTTLTFKASDSNSIYGSSKTVIPLSRKCKYIIKF